MSKSFCKKSPCANCPYRTDAPLQLWDAAEFRDLLAKDSDYMGTTYGCHKKDGKACTGWLMDQDRRGFPSIMLRLSLTRAGVTRVFLDTLKSRAPLYPSIRAMAHANYPDQFPAA